MIATLKSIQFSANKQGSTGPVTWDALNNMNRDEGTPHIDYRGFDARWKQEEQLPPEEQILHNLVDRYDGAGLVLKTDKKELARTKSSGESPVQKKLHQMARHAIEKS